jgi:hypothetical protein
VEGGDPNLDRTEVVREDDDKGSIVVLATVRLNEPLLDDLCFICWAGV